MEAATSMGRKETTTSPGEKRSDKLFKLKIPIEADREYKFTARKWPVKEVNKYSTEG